LDAAVADSLDADVEREIGAALEFALQSEVSGTDVLAIDHYAAA
jgi:hypothetical protein